MPVNSLPMAHADRGSGIRDTCGISGRQYFVIKLDQQIIIELTTVTPFITSGSYTYENEMGQISYFQYSYRHHVAKRAGGHA